MSCLKHTVTLSLVAVCSIASAAIMASELDAVTKECNDCHGEKGVSVQPETPTIAGLSGFFIEGALFAYVDEARPCVETKYPDGAKKGEVTTMCEITAALSEAQIVALGKHYQALPFVPAEQQFDGAKAHVGEQVHQRLCKKCHAEGGSDPLDDAGLLAGQWSPYLEQTFAHFRSGVRASEDKMLKAVQDLSDEDVDALVHYYASLTDTYQ